MAERGPLDDVNTVIASLYERLSGDLLPGRDHQSDREIIASLAADSRVIETLSFPGESLRQNKNLTLAKQLLAQGKYRDALCVIYFRILSTRWMKITQFFFIEEIAQWWPMGKYILKHK